MNFVPECGSIYLSRVVYMHGRLYTVRSKVDGVLVLQPECSLPFPAFLQ